MYKAVLAIVRFFVQGFCGLNVFGGENIPPTGGAIIVANHSTWFDPFAVALAVSRPIHFMAKAELFRNSLLKKLLSQVYAFPVKRGLADRTAIRRAQEIVRGGHLLGIFPEGTRNRGQGELLPLQGGAALISLKTGTPVIPVLVTGIKPLRFRRAIQVKIGEPIHMGGPKKTNRREVDRGSSLILAQFSELISRNN